MAKIFDRVGMTVSSVASAGTGAFTLSSAITDATNGNLRTFATAGAVDGDFPCYLAIEGNTWELGAGALSSTTTVLNRGLRSSSTGSLVTFTSAAKVYNVPATIDLVTASGKAQAFDGGIRPTAFDIGTVSSGTTTPDPGNGPIQKLTNNGAFTLAATSNDGGLDLMITNGATAGAITFSGFSKAVTGDTYATTNTNKYLIRIERINSISFYQITAMQ